MKKSVITLALVLVIALLTGCAPKPNCRTLTYQNITYPNPPQLP